MLTVDVTKTDHGLRACPSCPLSTLTSNAGNVQRDAAFFLVNAARHGKAYRATNMCALINWRLIAQ